MIEIKDTRRVNLPLNDEQFKNVIEQIANNNLESIQEDLSSKISQTFPQVTLNKVEVIGNPDTNTVTANIYYSVKKQSITDQIEINFG